MMLTKVNNLFCSANYLSWKAQAERVTRLEPFVLLDVGLYYRNLAHPKRPNCLCRAAGADTTNFADVKEDFVAWLADKPHVIQDGPVVAVFEGRPNALLSCRRVVERDRVGSRHGPTRDRGQETSAEENREDAKVLDGMYDADVAMPCAERVLNACAEFVGENHFLCTNKNGGS
jgi:hypothetical protein